ncbi:MAG: 30S ribosomal protein S7 [Omnitrophica WOR_2 bacterium RIFCSPHIGHO2_02_FULL_68_15]|nr:MAG: 30S ribosomal protein S7 [Omnitrophica WOR_2 bacterium RIFCSPHIGHO2_02_FULL_68_15]
MRRRQAERRELVPDPKYHSKLIARFINMLMTRGKRSLAERIVYNAFDRMKTQAQVEDVVQAFQKAVENARPFLEVKSRRVGGATYQVPVEIHGERGIALALRWLRDFARTKKGKPMEERLAEELVAAYRGEGSAVKRKEEMHRMAEANKAFSHYRW